MCLFVTGVMHEPVEGMNKIHMKTTNMGEHEIGHTVK